MLKKNIFLFNTNEDENINIIKTLENLNYKIELFFSLSDILENIKKNFPELIIISVNDINVIPSIEKMFINERIKNDIPKIYLIDNQIKDDIKVQYNELIEYIFRPINYNNLLLRVNQLIWIRNLQNEIKSKNEILGKIKLLDEVTNLYNYTYLQERFEEEMLRAVRYCYPISCIMIEIDNLEKISKNYEERIIHQLLKEMGFLLKKSIRVVDIIGLVRNGCFLIILPQTIVKGAAILGERIRDNIANQVFVINDNIIKITISVAITGEKSIEKEKIFDDLNEIIKNIKINGGNQTQTG